MSYWFLTLLFSGLKVFHSIIGDVWSFHISHKPSLNACHNDEKCLFASEAMNQTFIHIKKSLFFLQIFPFYKCSSVSSFVSPGIKFANRKNFCFKNMQIFLISITYLTFPCYMEVFSLILLNLHVLNFVTLVKWLKVIASFKYSHVGCIMVLCPCFPYLPLTRLRLFCPVLLYTIQEINLYCKVNVVQHGMVFSYTRYTPINKLQIL